MVLTAKELRKMLKGVSGATEIHFGLSSYSGKDGVKSSRLEHPCIEGVEDAKRTKRVTIRFWRSQL